MISKVQYNKSINLTEISLLLKGGQRIGRQVISPLSRKNRKYPMNELRVFAHGESFNPDAYLKTAPIQFDGAWQKGENDHDHPKSSEVFKVLGDGQKLIIFQQQEVAIEYLFANRDALRALAQQPDITTFVIGLQYHIKLEQDIKGFCMSPLPLLMELALDIGIDITFYVTLDRPQVCDCE